MPLTITILLIVIGYLVLRLKDATDRSAADREEKERVIDREYPYTVRGFRSIYAKGFSKHNYKTLEEAERAAREKITEVFLEEVFHEKTEVWYNGSLLSTHITKHRNDFRTSELLGLDRYDGRIIPNNDIISPTEINHSKQLTLRLTNGGIVILDNPFYLLHENSIRARGGPSWRGDSFKNRPNYKCIPLEIIEEVIYK